MTYPHRIRLRGPWDARFISSQSPSLPSDGGWRRVTLPAVWGDMLAPGFAGRVLMRRRFSQPTNLDPHERVWLVCRGIHSSARLCLNGSNVEPLAVSPSASRFDVTEQLLPRNEIDVEFVVTDEFDSPLLEHDCGEFEVQITATHVLESLTLAMRDDERGRRLHVVGRLIGPLVDRPLEIIVQGRGRELLYGDVMPEVAFELISEPLGLADEPVEVRLIGAGGALWIEQIGCMADKTG